MNVRTTILLVILCALSACQSDPPVEVSQDMKESWAMFLADDPGWPERREQWLSGTIQDRYMLLEALYVVLIGSGEVVDPAHGQIWGRAAREFVYVGQEAIAFLEPAMRQLTARRPVDRVAVDRVATVLADLYAVPEMTAAVMDPEASSDLRAAAVSSLTWMEDEEAIPALLHVLASDPEWSIRARSVDGLAPLASDRRVQDGLSSALEDADPLVREKAARALGRVRERRVQEVLVNHYEVALRSGDSRQAAALYEALCTSTGRFGVRQSSDAWRKILRGEG